MQVMLRQYSSYMPLVVLQWVINFGLNGSKLTILWYFLEELKMYDIIIKIKLYVLRVKKKRGNIRVETMCKWFCRQWKFRWPRTNVNISWSGRSFRQNGRTVVYYLYYMCIYMYSIFYFCMCLVSKALVCRLG
jgi:hypothetical protein